MVRSIGKTLLRAETNKLLVKKEKIADIREQRQVFLFY